jgi:hypothetical protein
MIVVKTINQYRKRQIVKTRRKGGGMQCSPSFVRLEKGVSTMKESQATNKVNDAEVLLPAETQADVVNMPYVSNSPMDMPVDRFTKALTRREQNRRALLSWIQDNLTQGTDFGRIHVVSKEKCSFAREGRAHECDNPRHWSKPSLWKPGAEKICGMLGLIPRFPNLKEYEHTVLRGEDIKIIILKCELETPSGFVAAEGTGARRIAQDNGDINKSLKMAEKSAHIDATLRVASLSEIFTQDIEDMIKENQTSITPNMHTEKHQNLSHKANENERHRSGQQGTRGNGSGAPSNQTQGQRLTSKQYRFILRLWEELGRNTDELDAYCIEMFGVSPQYLSKSDASSLIHNLLARKS